MNKCFEIFVVLTEHEKGLLEKKFSGSLALRTYLTKSLNKIIESECAEIESAQPIDGIHFNSNQMDDSSEKEIA